VIRGLIYGIGVSVGYLIRLQSYMATLRGEYHINHSLTNIQGLQLKKHTKGLDTGCVKGGRLTALIYPGEEVISVKCQDYEG
jgi:hypothetical protein